MARYENRKCKVYFLHGDLEDAEMHSLYQNKNINALVSLTHGEGFGLPLFEAAYKPTKNKKGKEKPKAHFAKIDYDLAPVAPDAVWDGVVQADSMWAYPHQGSYKMRLREVYKDYKRFKSQAKKLQKWLLVEFEEQKQHQAFIDSVGEYVKQFDVEDWLENLDINETDAAA